MNDFNFINLSSCLSLLELIISPRKLIYSFLMNSESKEINLFIIIQSPKSLFLEHIAKNIGLIREAFVSNSNASLSKAF